MADSEWMMGSSTFLLLDAGVVGVTGSVGLRTLLRLLGTMTSMISGTSSLTTLSFLTLFGSPLGRPRFFAGGTMGAAGSLEPEA